MARPIETYKKGKVEMAKWEGDYGYYYSVRKRYQDKQGNWKDSNSYGITDTQDLLTLCINILSGYVKVNKNQPTNQENVEKGNVNW